MSRKFIRFLGVLAVVLGVAFILHYTTIKIFQEHILKTSYLILSYLLNFIIAGALFYFLEKSIQKKSVHTGMYFLVGSAIKGIVFLIILYPLFSKDAVITTTEFIAFFVPYVVCQTLEVINLSKQLNNQSL